MGSKIEKLKKKREQIDSETRKLNVLHDTVERDRLVLKDTVNKHIDSDDSVIAALGRVNEASISEQLYVSSREAENAIAEQLLQKEVAQEVREATRELKKLKKARSTRFGEVANHPEQVLNSRLDTLEHLSKRDATPRASGNIEKVVNTVGWTLSGIALTALPGSAIFENTADNITAAAKTIPHQIESQYQKESLTDDQGREIFRTEISPAAQLEIIDNGEHFSGTLTVRRTIDEHISQAVTDSRDIRNADPIDVVSGINQALDDVHDIYEDYQKNKKHIMDHMTPKDN